MGNKSSATKDYNNIDNSFIVNFNRNNSAHYPPDALLGNKRVIFISLIGLYQTYETCPAHILYSALFILPLKRRWIYSPNKYLTEIHSVSSGLIKNDNDHRLKNFLQLLKWKDSQSFVFWAKDEYESSDSNVVHPFWESVSKKLVTLYDPITSENYEALPFDSKYWEMRIGNLSNEVVCELYFLKLKYENMKRLFHASNPESFRVITAYDSNAYVCINDRSFVMYQQLDDSDSDARDDDEWWISPDYCIT